MKEHFLKTLPAYFDEVWAGNKLFEVRKNDRNFMAYYILRLQEWDQEIDRYTGREIIAYVTYRLPGGRLGIHPDYCVMSLKILRKYP